MKKASLGSEKETEELKKLRLRVTELEKAQSDYERGREKLREDGIFLASIFENIPDMIFVKDGRDLKFVRLNQAGEELLGHPLSEMIGKSDYDFFPKEEADFFTRNDRRVLEEGKLLDIPEEPIRTRNKGTRWLHTKKIPLLDEKGKAKYLLGISQDITERKEAREKILRLNENLAQRNRDLAAANAELESFSYSVSHDLRAPLRAINGFCHILKEDHENCLNEEGKNLLRFILENTARMSELIDDLLIFSRLSVQELHKSRIDMESLVKVVVAEALTGVSGKKPTITIHPLPPATGDPSLIRQVLMNLISNAIKYSRKKESPLVEIGFSRNGPEGAYYVKDNGAGFNMHYADKLFGVFQRLHGNEFEGTGVGLAIVKSIIFRHRGGVWADSEEGQGAVFYFSLPVTLKTNENDAKA